MSLGQLSIFPPEKSAKLKNRVELVITPLADIAYILKKCHYLGRVRVGRQINYAVLVDGVVDGVITYAYPFTTSKICGVGPGEVIEFARMFLYRNVPHTASCAIGKSLRRVRRDWMKMYPDAPVPRLVVAWSDQVYHKGTIYKAANFTHDGVAVGRSNRHKGDCWGPRKKYNDYEHKKDRWIYWLDKKNGKAS